VSAEVLDDLPKGAPARPLVRWLGSKWRLADWIITHFPPHRGYVEPYGGSGAVLLRKPPARVEVLCDLDDDLLALYQVVRDPLLCGRLYLLCSMTPFSDAEYRIAMERLPPSGDPVERARRLLVRHAFQVSPDVRAETRASGFRRYSGDRHCAAHDWDAYPDALGSLHARLRGVLVERGDAVDCMQRHDRPDALHYVDPPYLPSTRSDPRKGYSHELDPAGHERLLDCVLALRGMVVISGYASELYDRRLAGWRRVTKGTKDHARRARTEVLWISPAADAASAKADRQPRLF
jgi:DNA adenine methylase